MLINKTNIVDAKLPRPTDYLVSIHLSIPYVCVLCVRMSICHLRQLALGTSENLLIFMEYVYFLLAFFISIIVL